MKKPLTNIKSNSSDKKVVSQSKSYSAPLPEASQFEQYEATCNGAGQKILDYMISEQQGRHRNDKTLLAIQEKQTDNIYNISTKNIRLKGLALILGFLLIVLMIIVSSFLIIREHEVLGFIFGAPAIATILYAFYSILKEDKHKSKSN